MRRILPTFLCGYLQNKNITNKTFIELNEEIRWVETYVAIAITELYDLTSELRFK